MLKVYHGPMLVLVHSLFGQNSDLKLPGHSRLVLAHDWIYHSLLWLWILFYTLYVCIFSIHRASGMINSLLIKDVKGGRNNKEWLQNSSFSLFPNVTPSLWTLYFCSCPQHMYWNSGSFYFPQRIIKVSMIFSHIHLFLSHFCDISILYCDLRMLPNSMSSSPSHQEDKSSWFFKKGLWECLCSTVYSFVMWGDAVVGGVCMNTHACLNCTLWVQLPHPGAPVPRCPSPPPSALGSQVGRLFGGLGHSCPCRGDLELCTCQYWGVVPTITSTMRLLLYLPYWSLLRSRSTIIYSPSACTPTTVSTVNGSWKLTGVDLVC